MAAKIRLKRFGTKNRIQWRIVVSDTRMPRDGRFIEEIGSYDPLPKEEKFQVNETRLEYWLKQGAQVSTALKSLLKRAKKKAKKAAAAR
ncbi:MAG: 30S ribosomal protein S16 [Candidatus Omnitrophica bacterium]|nr:30S ribosomal protein S16 [Candidatus Omnitrophota bacterium]